jgi:arylsulfatase A-like enzyme/cytochrome c-type biogenesis protein CcmH/NrfG
MSLRDWLVLLLLFVAGGSAPGLASPPNIVLITLDTTRADRMGFLGSQLGLTPNLDALARQSAVFTHAYSQVPLTTASHATILTGTYPQFHKVNDAGAPLAKDVPYGPAILRVRGYTTAAFVGCVILDPKAGGAPGFARGFNVYDAGFHSRRLKEDRYHSLERRGSDVVAHAAAWLDKHPVTPFFLWVHIYDPHAPYDPPEPFRTRYDSNPYDGEVAYADSVVGQLLDHLRATHLYDNSVIAVAADHGEAFGEHGERGHGIFLYDPTIHVPLLFKMPANASAGTRSETPVELVDVLPTVLQAAGIVVPQAVQGKSLLPIIHAESEAAPGRRAETYTDPYAETDYPNTQFGWSSLRALRTGKYLFIAAPRNELYDQSSDPAAEHNLASSSKAVADTLTTKLDKFRQQTRRSTGTPSARLDVQQAQQLRALGYLASSDSRAPAANTGIDPKDKIEIANQLTEANLALEDGQYQQALSQLQKVVAMDSSFAPAYMELGEIWTSLGDPRQAVSVLRKAVELRPESVSSHYALGMALFQVGDLKGAAAEFETAVARNPQSAEMHFSLATVYVRIDRMDDARKQVEKALALKPNDYDSNLMLGHILVAQKQPRTALPYLQKASRLRPGLPDAHSLMADAYAQLGQTENEKRERGVSQHAKAH